jgi:hypothetical protein
MLIRISGKFLDVGLRKPFGLAGYSRKYPDWRSHKIYDALGHWLYRRKDLQR